MVTMRGRAAAAAVAVMLLTAGGVRAQGGPVPSGEPATYVDLEGVERGTVTVTELIDPYTDHPADRGPEPGTRFVIAVLAFEGLDGEGVQVYTPTISLQDTTGALWSESLPCCITDDFPQPELTISTVGPGSRITGFIGFTLPSDVEVEAILVQPDDGVMLIPLDLGSERPAVDTPVLATGADGATMSVTVSAAADPYKGFDSDRPPADGTRYVQVTAAFENTGDQPFALELNGLLLRDARGNLWAPVDIEPKKKPKVPQLQRMDLGPGNRVTGWVGYQVPADVPLEGLYYSGGSHLTRLLAFAGAGSGPGTGPATGCDAVQEWWGQVGPTLERLAALPPFQADAAPMDEAATQAMLTELEDLVATHLAVSPPEGVVPQHRRFLAALLLFEGSARDQLAAQQDASAEQLYRSQEGFEAAMLAMGSAFDTLRGDEAIGGCID